MILGTALIRSGSNAQAQQAVILGIYVRARTRYVQYVTLPERDRGLFTNSRDASANDERRMKDFVA